MGERGSKAAGSGALRARELGTGTRRAVALVVLAGLVLMGATALSRSSALAATGHKFLSQLSEAPPGTPLGAPEGVAVDKAGDVFVADAAAGVVDVFDSGGAFKAQLGSGVLEGELPGVAVDSSGKVYVADAGTATVDVFRPNGSGGYELLSQWSGASTPSGAFFEPAGVAVDNSTSSGDPSAGDVYVLDRGEALVYVFKPAEGATEGKFLTTIKGGKLEAPSALAVDSSTGKLYVGDDEKKAVVLYSASHKVEGKPLKGTGTPTGSFGVIGGVGVEEATHDLYVVDSEARALDQFDPTGTWIGTVQGPGTDRFSDPRGVAIAAAGEVSVSDVGAAVVDRFGPNIIVPDVTTGAATKVERTAATLNGSVNPQGKAKYHFEYGETEAYGSNTPAVAAEGTTPISVQAIAAGLKPGTKYDFRLTAENENGVNFGRNFEFRTPPAVTGVSTGAASKVEPTSAILGGSLRPEGIATTYHFEYGETAAYGKSSPEAATSATGTVAAEAAVAGLTPNTTYHFRLAATNGFGTTDGLDASFKTAGPPTIVEPTASDSLSPTSEQVTGTIDPGKLATRYHVQFGETTSYGNNTSEAEIPAGEGPVSAPATLTGLTAGTVYHFRFLATNTAGTAEGPDHQFRISTTPGGSGSLPDNRAYEMVSPPDKKGAFIEGINRIGGVVQASEEGGALAYVVDGAIVEDPEGNRSPEAQQVLSTRSSGGWLSQEIVAPHDRAFGVRVGVPPEYVLFSSDLSLSLLQPFPFGLTALAEPPLSPPLSPGERGKQEKSIYLRENAPISPGASETEIYEQARRNGETLASEHGEAEARPGYLPLVSAANVAPGTQFGGTAENGSTQKVQPNIFVLDASPDLSHVILVSTKALAPEGPSAPGLYEWSKGKLQLVSVLPGASGTPETAFEPDLGFGAAQINHQVGTNFRHAVSDDGSRVVWTSAESEQGGLQGLGHLYVRDTSRGETVQLDEPGAGPIAEPGKAQFQIASSDGSKIFFTDTQRLTADSGAEPEVESQGVPPRPDLYECEMVVKGGKLTCELSDLTPRPQSGEGAAVRGVVLGASEDGSYVYFVANGVLAPGATPGGCATKPGQPPPPGTTCNLYVVHRSGKESTTSLIARLSSEDAPDWFNQNLNVSLLVDLTARVSPNGRYLAFMSNRRLTGYDNTDVNEAGGRHADEEVFLYDASLQRVVCASCNPTGARPNGVFDQRFAGEGEGLVVDRPQVWAALEANPGVDHWLAGNIPGWTPLFINGGLYQSRYLSDSGRLFFNSADPLVPAAVGHTRKEKLSASEKEPEASVGVENVYQFEPNGIGNCTTASGCVGLISAGTSDRESAFMDASASGNDVFFLTAAPLLPEDLDANFDVYDARVCSEASPCLPPVPLPAEPCGSAATCREGSASPPSFLPPPSSDLTTAGNPAPPAQVATLPSTVRKLTRAQKLARALKACRKLPHKTKAQKKKRAVCEAQARRKYKVKASGKKTRSAHGRAR